MTNNRHWFRLLVGCYLPASVLMSGAFVDAGNIHRKELFNLVDRRDASASSIEDKDASQLLADLQLMQAEISAFPAELSNFLHHMEADIKSLESVLEITSATTEPTKATTLVPAVNNYLGSAPEASLSPPLPPGGDDFASAPFSQGVVLPVSAIAPSTTPSLLSVPSGGDDFASAPFTQGAALQTSANVPLTTLSAWSFSSSPSLPSPPENPQGPDKGVAAFSSAGVGNAVSGIVLTSSSNSGWSTFASSSTPKMIAATVAAAEATANAAEDALTAGIPPESSVFETIMDTVHSTSTRFTTITRTLKRVTSTSSTTMSSIMNPAQLTSSATTTSVMGETSLSSISATTLAGAVAAASSASTTGNVASSEATISMSSATTMTKAPSTKAAVATSSTTMTSDALSTTPILAKSSTSTMGSVPAMTADTGSASVSTVSQLTTETAASSSYAHAGRAIPTVGAQPSASAQTSSSGNSWSPADSRDNMVVYYGQSSETTVQGLLKLCQTPHINIINLAFVTELFGPGGWPSVDFGPACSSPSAAQAQYASGLKNCTQLGAQISQCQQTYHKKILVSVGGAAAGAASSIPSSAQATLLAHNLWALFGGGSTVSTSLPPNTTITSTNISSSITTSIRPFGADVVLDGIDIDNEDHSTAYWGAFATALRALYRTDPSRAYYLSSTPQCPRPDASIPSQLMAASDWVSVQFFNNPACQLSNAAGFAASLRAWNQQLASYPSTGTTTGKSPRLMIGMGAWSGAGSGYVPPQQLATLFSADALSSASNLAGVMMWDGQEALANVDAQGNSYVDVVGSAVAHFT